MSDSPARPNLLSRAQEATPWDVVVLGGGATGLGAGLEAASRGYRTLLVDRGDFASGTSSRSTKLIHGGVRYLQQGNVGLVSSALKERARLVRNAPHVVTDLPLLVPSYHWWERPYYGIGLKLYDLLAGRHNLRRSEIVSKRTATQRLSTLEDLGLRGGVIYHDGQFDDARLAWCMARTMADLGSVPLNYVEAIGLTKARRSITGVALRDSISGKEWTVQARVVINASGPFADVIRTEDDETSTPVVVVSQGAHIVVSSAYLPGKTALLVPSTDDGRVIFAIPWQGHVVIGTTDVKKDHPTSEPRATLEEVDYLIAHVQRYLTRPLSRDDVQSVWAGLRALALAGGGGATSKLSRDHAISVSASGLVSIVGGKWTTYRKMGVDVVNRAADVGGLSRRASRTKRMRLHGWSDRTDVEGWRRLYGSDLSEIEALEKEDASLCEILHPSLPFRRSQVVFACRAEMAVRIEDVLARRTRALFLNAKAALDASEEVARLMAEELGQDEVWQRREVAQFKTLAEGYLVPQA